MLICFCDLWLDMVCEFVVVCVWVCCPVFGLALLVLVIGWLLWLFGVLSVCVLVFWLGLLCAAGFCFALSCGLWLSCLYVPLGLGLVGVRSLDWIFINSVVDV